MMKPMIAAMGLLLATQVHAQFSDYQRYLTVSDGASFSGDSQRVRYEGQLFESFTLRFNLTPLAEQQNDIGQQLTFGLNLKLSDQAFLERIQIQSASANVVLSEDPSLPHMYPYPGVANGDVTFVSQLGTRKRTVDFTGTRRNSWLSYTLGGGSYRLSQEFDSQAPWIPYALDYQQHIQLDQMGWSWSPGYAQLSFLAPVAPVPEPETYALMSAGLLALVLRRRRAKKS